MLVLDVSQWTRHGCFEVQPKDKDGWDLKDLIRTMPSCRYVKKRRCYEISFSDYRYIRKTFQNHGVLDEVVVTPDWNEMYKRYVAWIKKLLALRDETETSFDVDTALPLYMHQRVGAQFLIKRRWGVLADEMGVGKSPTSSAAAWHLIQTKKIKRAIIVCPASVKMQWASDTLDVFLPQATYTIVGSDFSQLVKKEVRCPKAGTNIQAKHGNKVLTRRVPRHHMFSSRRVPCRGCFNAPNCKALRGDGLKANEIRARQYQADTDFIIVNYELLRMDVLGKHKVDKEGNKLKTRHPSLFDKMDIQFDLFICDEAHRLRNTNTDTFDALWKIAKNAPYRWALTGTPLQTRLEDAWGIMRFVNPAVMGTSRYAFLERYANRDMWGKVESYCRVDEVHQKLRPNMIRRLKDDVLDLPPFINSYQYVDLSADERSLYNAVANQQVSETQVVDDERRDHLNKCEPITTVLHGRQAGLSMNLIDKSRPFESSKVKEIMKVLEDVTPDHKVVLFCEFAEFLSQMVGHIRGKNIGCLYLHGGVPSGKKRQELVNQFRSDDEIRVFCTTTAGGEGLNLQCADVIILANLTWNPAQLSQVKARLHRIGQHKPVNVIYFVSRGTVEEKVLGDVRYRQILSDKVVDGEELPDTPPIPLSEMVAMM